MSGFIDQQFVLLLMLFEELFRVTEFMSDQLQSPSLELSSTIDSAESVMETLSDKCAEESWSDIQDRAADLFTKASVSHGSTPERRKAQPPLILQFVVQAPIEGTLPSPDVLHSHCFYPVTDRLVWGVLTGVLALSLKHASFLDKECLHPMA